MNLKRIGLVAVAAILVVAVLGVLIAGQYRQFLDTPLAISDTGLVLQVQPGDTLLAVVGALEKEGVTKLDWRWRILGRTSSKAIQVGEYELMPPLQPHGLLDLLASGRVLQHRFTLVEGWTWKQLLAALAADPVLNSTIEWAIHPAEVETVADTFNAPGLEHAEGWFLPETYYFARGAKDVDILQRAHQAMQSALAEAWEGRGIGLPLETPYELLILASIVEKETAIDEERGQIAGVLVRRLQQGMRLQTDPTVIYGMGDAYDGNIRRRDLRTDTPYNTYTRHGLPPTPIAMPGRKSLLAAANPSDGDALYFVANGDGGHTFSATLEEHEKAVRKLIERQ